MMSKSNKTSQQQIDIIVNHGKPHKYQLHKTLTFAKFMNIVRNSNTKTDKNSMPNIVYSGYTIQYPLSTMKKISNKNATQDVMIALVTTTKDKNVLMAVPFVKDGNKNLRVTSKNIAKLTKEHDVNQDRLLEDSNMASTIEQQKIDNNDDTEQQHGRLRIPIELFVMDVIKAIDGLDVSERLHEDGLMRYDLMVESFGVSYPLRLDMALALLKLSDSFPLDLSGDRIEYVTPVSFYDGQMIRWRIMYSRGNDDVPSKERQASIDHVIPSALGGKTTLCNLVLMRKDKNAIKGDTIGDNTIDNLLEALVVLELLLSSIARKTYMMPDSNDQANVLESLKDVVVSDIADARCMLVNRYARQL